jgi:hypothetical protein
MLPNISRDQAWDRTVRFFEDHNLPVKTIDRSSGFIESDMISFVSAYQIDSGPSVSQIPYVVTQRENTRHMVIQPSYITGYLKVFLLNDSTQTEVRVNIEDLRNYHLLDVYHKHGPTTHNEILREAVSTGQLESQLIGSLTTGREVQQLPVQNGEVLNPAKNYTKYINKRRRITMWSLISADLGLVAGIATVFVLIPKH